METKITNVAIKAGIIACLFAAIWDEDTLKWVASSVVLVLAGQYLGVSFKDERIVGEKIVRSDASLDFTNLRKSK